MRRSAKKAAVLIARRWLLAAVAGMVFGAGAQAQRVLAAPNVMPVGVVLVPAEPVPGAKVRTPARIEVLLMQGLPQIRLQQVSAARSVDGVLHGTQGAWLGVLPSSKPLPSGVQRRVLAWSASPMAIMRTDTTVRSWKGLKGHTVCLAADGRYEGELAERFGIVEKVYPSVTDALLALRTGQCDATVQDEGFLRQILKFPEWRKFSATLEPYRHEDLAALMRTDLPNAWRSEFDKETEPARVQALAKQQARDIAFEVYLDQAAPDCH